MNDHGTATCPDAPTALQPRRLACLRRPVAQRPAAWQVTPLRRQDRIERPLDAAPLRRPVHALPPQSPVGLTDYFSIELDAEGDDAFPSWVHIRIA